ncbi:amidohydrolase family protein [Nocardiopsis changdeensis]|uniref:Amidohydrolase family protein n=1 Tax=Nocardiopsis changdeensis TaxID=2831969 RepID=A0ABX8BHM2_9ACTN|nr:MULTISPECIES: amidohydrolase family protein [Nocardiopsis]QUX21492.1 amidohydrolase family protein [Nocardiopsis changdeensis]QYX37426.1 amidohydrolase family protein [Nocardiopsis sp. MT53]
MTDFETVIRSRRVVTPEGVAPAAVGVRDGRIEAVAGPGARWSAREEVDLGDTALLPGAVDLGTGVYDPGLEAADCYREAGAAALRGGVTTLVVSPAPARPAVICADDLQAQRRAAAGSPVGLYFLGGVTSGSGSLDLADLRAAGAVAFQCSLSDGGAPDMAALDDAWLRKAMAELAALDAVLLVHAEDARELGTPPLTAEQRPPRAERRGLERVISAARSVGTRTHVVPFTAAECAALLSAAGSIGVGLSAQTCPHYLCLPAEVLDPESPAHACRPPLRSDANRKALWSALLEPGSAITTVSSGHLPAHGLYTLRWSLSALWTAARRRGAGLDLLSRWTAAAPAELLGLAGKGRIAPGCDADLVAFAPERPVSVPGVDRSPYAGRGLVGEVGPVWVAGMRAPSGDSGPPHTWA